MTAVSLKTVNKSKLSGHMAALLCAVIWGTTFISTKVVLSVFTPIEILVIRFFLGYILLWLIRPEKLEWQGVKREKDLALAGAFGISLYYLAENYALEFSSAGNVSLIVSTAPFFIALMFRIMKESDEKFSVWFFLGFVMAISGIALMNFSSEGFSFSPAGDLLAFLGAFLWGIYSVFIRRASSCGYDTIVLTRRTFFYGLLVLVPVSFITGFDVSLSDFSSVSVTLNVLYLGLGASAVCFAVWNHAIKALGAITSGVYIYLVPAVTVVFSYFFLGDEINPSVAAGTVLVIAGLFVSEKKNN